MKGKLFASSSSSSTYIFYNSNSSEALDKVHVKNMCLFPLKGGLILKLFPLHVQEVGLFWLQAGLLLRLFRVQIQLMNYRLKIVNH